MVHTQTVASRSPYSTRPSSTALRAVELFAGVGGFRLGLERTGWSVVSSNQWEPATKGQHASDCYVQHFGADGHANQDISNLLDEVENGERQLPEHELIVGGFPCQDYSVARTLSQAAGLVGRKGVLWWEIYRILRLTQPRFIFLENVDRLLKSPATQRGRDFAVMLACLAGLGYTVEWRVVNAADYGFPQRRRRVFIVGERTAHRVVDPMELLCNSGTLADALPVEPKLANLEPIRLDRDLSALSSDFGRGLRTSPFANAGVMQEFRFWGTDLTPDYCGQRMVLGDIIQDEESVTPSFFVPEGQVETWQYLKGAKSELRTHYSGFSYSYSEGSMVFPDPLDRPSRTILTAEGGLSPSRFKHVIVDRSGRMRRLTPIELERLNGFPDDWTAGVPDTRRSFLMGNALVVGIVERIAHALARRAKVAPTQPRMLADPPDVKLNGHLDASHTT